ncbi:MAG: D-glycero-beta-D-manno-heptose 1-phosphate adenylyltransferase [Nitrospirae bacterium]|nr:MAG: D-glycero-beta-D-manno-heptose 1-phosphate adenylyltransferase [Nitrospirota bacterium]
MKQKIKTIDSLLRTVEPRRRAGSTLVFTNGCFDLLHIGHVRYLQQAKQFGDMLVVGVNSDASVKQLNKGPGRPIIPDAQRAEIVAALECVDFVVIFDEPDPLSVVQALTPDVLVKGGDWPLDRIIGRDHVENHGGRVYAIPLIPDISTSRIIDRIMQEHAAVSDATEHDHSHPMKSLSAQESLP